MQNRTADTKHREEKNAKFRQTPTCGYETLILEVLGIFIFSFRAYSPILQPPYGHAEGMVAVSGAHI